MQRCAGADLAAADDYDVVISDIGMPLMDGYELVAALRANPRTASWKAIAVSGFTRAIDEERAGAAGFDAHLAKPVSIDELIQTLSQQSAPR